MEPRTLPIEIWVAILKHADHRTVFAASLVSRCLNDAAKIAAPQAWSTVESALHRSLQGGCEDDGNGRHPGQLARSLLRAESTLSVGPRFTRRVLCLDASEAVVAMNVSEVKGQIVIVVAYSDTSVKIYNQAGKLLFNLRVKKYFHPAFNVHLLHNQGVVMLPRLLTTELATSYVFACSLFGSAHMIVRMRSVGEHQGSCHVRGLEWNCGLVIVFQTADGHWRNCDRMVWTKDADDGLSFQESISLGNAMDVIADGDRLIHLHRSGPTGDSPFRYHVFVTDLSTAITVPAAAAGHLSNSPSASIVRVPIGPVNRFIARGERCGVVEGRVHDSGGLLQLDAGGRLRFGSFGCVLHPRALLPDIAVRDFFSRQDLYIGRSTIDPCRLYVVSLLDTSWDSC